MKKPLYTILILALVACKGETKKNDTRKSEKETSNVFKNVEKSNVTVILDGTEYRSPVNCSYFNEDYFYFKSDKLETTDTNGDGIIITGYQQDDKMLLTLIVDGKTYSTSNLTIQKKEFKATGAGKLFLEGTTDSFNTTYKVSCK